MNTCIYFTFTLERNEWKCIVVSPRGGQQKKKRIQNNEKSLYDMKENKTVRVQCRENNDPGFAGSFLSPLYSVILLVWVTVFPYIAAMFDYIIQYALLMIKFIVKRVWIFKLFGY